MARQTKKDLEIERKFAAKNRYALAPLQEN